MCNMKSRWVASLVFCSAAAITFAQQPPDDALYQPVGSLPEGLKLIEGDIAVPIAFDETRATYVEQTLWPTGLVRFQYNPNVSGANRALMRAAMDEWESLANVTFVPWTPGSSANYIVILNATFNASEGIGMLAAPQRVWINNWNTHGTLVHELGHVLGYWHEQSRLDSTAYITVNFGNVCQTCCADSGGNPVSCNSQFALRTSGDEHGPYDFESVMHYSACAFSSCATCTPTNAACRTITVNPAYFNEYQSVIGQRNGASYWDGRVMSYLYSYADWVFVAVDTTGFQLGTFFDPYQGLDTGMLFSDPGDTLLLLPGSYEAVGRWTEPRRIESTAGGVFLGN
ncbi:MAG: M12 family metallopeptidase [Phycisphaerae bacterium]|nr:M12 family metallopeptidase [Phycisphaerae bacterium]